ncbi:MAG: DMT family transporter [Aestuariivirgaceae bacterium]
MTKPGFAAYALLMALALIWGGSFLFIKIGVETIPPITLTALRLIAAAVILIIAARLAGQFLPVNKAVWSSIALAALFGNALPFTLISWGEEVIDSGLAAILMAGMPLFTLVCAHLVTDDEKMNRRKVIGVMCGLAGLIVLIGPDKLSQLGDDAVRQLAVAAASLCYAVHALIIRRIKAVPAKALAAGIMIASTVMIVPMALVLEQPWQLEPSNSSLAAALVLGIFQTAIATLMMFALIQKQGATFFSQINFLVPLIGVAYGIMFLAERPQPSAYVALGLILAGIYIVRTGGMGAVPANQPASNSRE